MTSYQPNPVVTFANSTTYSDNTIANISITMGRSDVIEQPKAGYARIELWTTADAPLNDITLSGAVSVAIDKGTAGTQTIFSGIISDIDISIEQWGSISSEARYTITAVGPLANLQKHTAGAAGYAKEVDGTRILNILTEAFLTSWDDIGATVTWDDLPLDMTWDSWDAVNQALVDGLATQVDTGSYELMAYTDGQANALDLAQTAAQSGRGVLYENGDGSLSYDDLAHRSTNTPLTLTGDDILANSLKTAAQWSEIVNDVDVTYRAGTANARDETSIYSYGELSGTRDTVLHNLTDAENQAADFIATRAYPRVYPEAFTIPLHSPSVTDATRDSLAAVYNGLPIYTDELPAIFGTIFNGYVEGWTWNLTRYEAFLTLVCSAYQETYADTMWIQLPNDLIWDNIPGTTTWEDL